MTKGLRFASYEAHQPLKPRVLVICDDEEVEYTYLLQRLGTPESPCALDRIANGFQHEKYTDEEVVDFIRNVAMAYQTYGYAILSPHYVGNATIRAALSGLEILDPTTDDELIKKTVTRVPAIKASYSAVHGREGIEWVNFVIDDAAEKNVLLIGDSISWGYYAAVKQLLGDGYSVSAVQTSANSAQDAFRRYVERMMAVRHYDIIHANVGCHSSAIESAAGAYRAHLASFLDYLSDRTEKLIFALTTPLWIGKRTDKGWEGTGEMDTLRSSYAYAKNAAAVDVCNERGIPVNNLFNLVVKKSQPSLDGIHYKDYTALAEQVVSFIRGI